MYKITGADGKEYGPVTTEQLRQWIAEGRVNAQTRILAEGATEWRPLSELPEFAAAMPTAPPPGLTAAPMPSPGAQAQVSGPATGLIVVAILGFLAQVVGLVINMARPFANRQMMEQPAWVNMFSGVGAIVGAFIGILMGVLILFGAMKMKKLENYGLAMTCSIIAMIPCVSPCCLIGLPIGIWAVVVLSKPEIKSAFH
jgi:hypothetical protein